MTNIYNQALFLPRAQTHREPKPLPIKLVKTKDKPAESKYPVPEPDIEEVTLERGVVLVDSPPEEDIVMLIDQQRRQEEELKAEQMRQDEETRQRRLARAHANELRRQRNESLYAEIRERHRLGDYEQLELSLAGAPVSRLEADTLQSLAFAAQPMPMDFASGVVETFDSLEADLAELRQKVQSSSSSEKGAVDFTSWMMNEYLPGSSMSLTPSTKSKGPSASFSSSSSSWRPASKPASSSSSSSSSSFGLTPSKGDTKSSSSSSSSSFRAAPKPVSSPFGFSSLAPFVPFGGMYSSSSSSAPAQKPVPMSDEDDWVGAGIGDLEEVSMTKDV
jgi:hypothetical protein